MKQGMKFPMSSKLQGTDKEIGRNCNKILVHYFELAPGISQRTGKKLEQGTDLKILSKFQGAPKKKGRT